MHSFIHVNSEDHTGNQCRNNGEALLLAKYRRPSERQQQRTLIDAIHHPVCFVCPFSELYFIGWILWYMVYIVNQKGLYHDLG